MTDIVPVKRREIGAASIEMFIKDISKIYLESLCADNRPNDREFKVSGCRAIDAAYDIATMGVSCDETRASMFAVADAVKAAAFQYPALVASEHPNVVYFIHNPRKNIVKIGRTKNKTGRFKSLGVGKWTELLFHFECDTTEECKLHSKFAEHRVHGEWFNYCDEIKSYIEHLKSKHGGTHE